MSELADIKARLHTVTTLLRVLLDASRHSKEAIDRLIES